MKPFALLVVLPLALLALPGVLVVDVTEGGPDGHRIVVPVPVALAQLALPLVPERASHVHCSRELERWSPTADRLMQELGNQPDFTLAEVVDRDEHVLVRKAGRCLLVDVTDGRDESVHLRVPLRCARQLLASVQGGQLHKAVLAKALWTLPNGDLVRVSDGDDRVRIWKL